MKIGLVELPTSMLLDEEGTNWTESPRNPVLLSKQVLLSNLEAGNFEPHLVNLRKGNHEEEYGLATWKGKTLRKVIVGRKIADIDPRKYDAWGVTVNFLQDRDVARMTIEHLASGGKPVVVGGSDALAKPQIYLQAGATAVVQDKSGAANWAVFDYVLGRPPREALSGVIFADGHQYPRRTRPLVPEDWPLPSLDIVKQCLGLDHYFYSHDKSSSVPDNVFPQGAVMPDLGCDRKCDFCQTPTYGLGYRRMSPQRALQWFALQKEAGARSVQNYSDQFLGRVLFKEGRQEILEIVKGLREMELPVCWTNGLEIKKATLGRGIRPDSDLTPDEELVEAVWGWDGKVGCAEAYIPAERPFVSRESYAKLLPWKQHRQMLRTIVRAGVPVISYGVIVGLPEDDREGMLRLHDALIELSQELKAINPSLLFNVLPFAVIPLPGTPQEQNLQKLGLLRFEDPAILGGWWTCCADTHHLSYEEVSDWQLRLLKTSDGFSSCSAFRKNPELLTLN